MECLRSLWTRLKHAFSPPGQTPIDPVIVITVFICSLGNAMIITMPFSFLPRMMREFGIEEKEIGNYVGIVASSLFVGRSFGSYLWGWLCDRIGRKHSLAISTGLIALCTLMFGFSQSYVWALITRFLQGLCGGLIIALKATIFALCDETNSSLGMAIIISSFQIGLIVGPAVGGFLVFPAESFPSTFSKDSLFGKFPYLLPVFITFVMLVISLFLTIVKIPETLKREKTNEKTNLLNDSGSKSIEGPSRRSRKYLDMYTYDIIVAKESYTVFAVQPNKEAEHEKDSNNAKTTVSHFQIECDSVMVQTRPASTCCRGLKESSLWQLIKIRNVQLSLALYAVFSFISTGFDETFPVYADSSKIYGGLNFASDQIGTAILIAAAPMVGLVFVIARLERRFGSKKLLIGGLYLLVFGLPLFAFIGYIPFRYVWYLLIPFLFVVRLTFACCFMVINVILNCAADPKYMGLVNGLGMTASCVFRSIAPTILGSLYSWSLTNEGTLGYPFNHHFSFVLSGFTALITLVIAVFLPDRFPAQNLIEVTESEVTNHSSSDEGPEFDQDTKI
ncbi:uncharacterized protein LOC135687554 isoform X1 [Rhopilema esculentum]|uniref:uncharacterized protein LOC135687554 isoform X1 n=2 Tax=Rhopilema esculentum TaxID=499914 RepID=UPI0031D9EC56